MTQAYVRRDEAAKYLGVSVRTVADWQRRGVLPFVKPCRKVTLFAVTDLDKAMRRFRVQAMGESGTRAV